MAVCTDADPELWVELHERRAERSGGSAPRAFCKRAAQWAGVAACEVGPAAGEVVQTYDARTGAWNEVPAELEVGDEYLHDGHLVRVTAAGVEDRGKATVEDLAASDETWLANAAHRVPDGAEWVLVLGQGDEAGHWRLAEVGPGERFAFQGRVFETGDADGDGRLEVRATRDVLGRVVNTFVRDAPEVIDAEITYADGTMDVLTGTPNHPFWVDAVRDYVPLGELEIGARLHAQGGGEAILVSKTWRQGDFEVFDFEVEGLHNFYVRGPGADAAGVLVHNSTARKQLSLPLSRKTSMDSMTPTSFQKVDSGTRQRILARDQNPDGTWTCATCGHTTDDAANIEIGHVQARSRGGDLSDGNLRCEGIQCNRSQGNRGSPKTTCKDAGGCGAPAGRYDDVGSTQEELFK